VKAVIVGNLLGKFIVSAMYHSFRIWGNVPSKMYISTNISQRMAVGSLFISFVVDPDWENQIKYNFPCLETIK